MTNPFLTIDLTKPTTLLDAQGTSLGHRWDVREQNALTAAYAARRPLLVRGEAGSGKSQLAAAAAAVLGTALFKEVIHARFEAHDLLYRFDAVQRLADAQARDTEAVRNVAGYVKPGVLWRAFEASEPSTARPVVLIDEIDKADADIPNALLDVLGTGSFVNDYTHDIIRPASGEMPLILITTNEERELPAAFVRRCLVLNLNPPGGEHAFKRWLIERAMAHPDLADLRSTTAAHRPEPEPGSDVVAVAAERLWVERQAAIDAGQQRVGLAEYIDLLRALVDLTRDVPVERRASEQLTWLRKLDAYFLVKGADMDAARGAGTDGLD